MTKTKFMLFTLFFLAVSVTAQAASIKGKVVYDGEAPKFRELKLDADPICLSKHTEAVFPQTLVLGDGQTIANVFVHITKGVPKQAYTAPTEAVVVTQAGCMYDPHVFGAMVGQPVQFLNPDGTLHNVHALSKINPEFNLAMPKFRTETTKTFDKPEFMFQIKCDVHPWMATYASIMDHPFFMTTKEDGNFEIADLPDGTYEVTAWHEKLGTMSQSVTIEAGQDFAEVNFTLSRPDKKN